MSQLRLDVTLQPLGVEDELIRHLILDTGMIHGLLRARDPERIPGKLAVVRKPGGRRYGCVRKIVAFNLCVGRDSGSERICLPTLLPQVLPAGQSFLLPSQPFGLRSDYVMRLGRFGV